MPDKVVTTPASGKVEFFNDDGTEIASLEAKNTAGDSSTDEVEAKGIVIKGGSYTSE